MEDALKTECERTAQAQRLQAAGAQRMTASRLAARRLRAAVRVSRWSSAAARTARTASAATLSDESDFAKLLLDRSTAPLPFSAVLRLEVDDATLHAVLPLMKRRLVDAVRARERAEAALAEARTASVVLRGGAGQRGTPRHHTVRTVNPFVAARRRAAAAAAANPELALV